VSRPFLRRLYFGGRDALPLGLRRLIRRVVPVEGLFGIRKPAAPPDALPPLPRDERPGRPDLILLAGTSTKAEERARRAADAIAATGGRVFLSVPGGQDAAPASPGVVVVPALDPESAAGVSDDFSIRHAVSVVTDPAAAEDAERLRRARGWPVIEWRSLVDGGSVADAPAIVARARALFPPASVVVVTYGNLTFNRACLESIVTRTAWPNLELVFVDNASADGTREWLEEQRRTCAVPLTVIANADNRGFAAAVNQGLEAAAGEYVCLLNNDTVVTEGWLSALIAHLDGDPGLGMIGPSTNEIAN